MRTTTITWLFTVAAIILAGCGSGTPAAEQPVAPVPSASAKAETQPLEAEGSKDNKEGEKIAQDVKDMQAKAEQPSEQQARRPMAIFNDPSEPTTIGLDGAVFRLESGAELRIPSGAFTSPRNVFFTKTPKVKGKSGKMGDVFEIQLRIPGVEVNLAQPRASSPVSSSSDPFIIKLPLPSGIDTAYLAVETISLDGKGKAKSEWTTVAQTKLETADTANKAVFELPQLPDGHIHLTKNNP